MHRQLLSLGLLCLLPTCWGCAMCCGTDDYNYGAYGGRWQRHDLAHGRVGSLFAPAGYDTLGTGDPLSAAGEEDADIEQDDAPRRAPGDDDLPAPGDDDLPAPGGGEVTGVDSSRNELASFIW